MWKNCDNCFPFIPYTTGKQHVPPKGTIFIGNISSNHQFSRDMLVFRGVAHSNTCVFRCELYITEKTFFSCWFSLVLELGQVFSAHHVCHQSSVQIGPQSSKICSSFTSQAAQNPSKSVIANESKSRSAKLAQVRNCLQDS